MYVNGGIYFFLFVVIVIYYGELIFLGVMLVIVVGFGFNSGNLKMSIEVVLVGVIIGKVGVNVK